MIRVGPLSRARVRAACYALRVRWAEELERQRDDALARVRGLEVERDQLRRIGERAVADRDKLERTVGRARELADGLRATLTAAGHGDLASGHLAVDLWRAVDEVIGLERHRLDGAEAERDAAMNTIGQIAAELGLPGAPQRFNVPAIVERIRLLVQEQATRFAVSEAPREAYDPAMGGDIEPPPGRPYPPGTGPRRPGDRPVEQRAVVEATIGCGMLADGVECGGEDGHSGGCWPDPRALAREVLVKHDIVHGVVAAAAALVLDEEHLLTDRGLTVDGDVLTEVIGQGLPTQWSDQACRATADRILDLAVHAGMTVVQGPDLTPRQVAEVPF